MGNGESLKKDLLVKIVKFLSYITMQYKIYQHSPVGLFGVHHLKTTIQSLLNYNKPRKKLQYVEKLKNLRKTSQFSQYAIV